VGIGGGGGQKREEKSFPHHKMSPVKTGEKGGGDTVESIWTGFNEKGKAFPPSIEEGPQLVKNGA